MGLLVTALINVSSAVQHSGVQVKGVFFLVRAVSGHAMSV